MKRLFVLAMFASLMLSQTATLTFQSDVLNNRLNRLSINDFDFLGQGKTKQLFRGTIQLSDITDDMTISFSMKFFLIYNGKRAVSADTKPISGVVNQNLSFTNTQIGTSINMQTKNGPRSLTFDNVSFNSSSGIDVKSNIISTLPDGTYKIRAEIYFGNALQASDEREFTLRQSWPINLMNPVGEVNTPTPLFQWDSRAAKYPKVTLYVWQKDGNRSASIAKRPIIKRVFDNPEKSIIPTSFGFPADNDRQLEDGKKYFWTVRVTINTAAGPKEEPNEILEFTYKQPKNDNINATAVWSILKQLLGNAAESVEQEFSGYDLKSLTINGDAAQINNLAVYIQKVTSGEYNLLVETY